MSRSRARGITRRGACGEIHPGVLIAGLLVAVALAWYFARTDPVPDGRPALAPLASEPAGAVAAGADRGGTSGPARALYRWTDAAGVVHFTDVPPPDRPFVEVDINPERNVIRSTDASDPADR